jgi:tight adherence protein B
MQETVIGLILSSIVAFSLAVLLLPIVGSQRPPMKEESHVVISQLRRERISPLDVLQQRLDRAQVGLTSVHYLLISSFAGMVAYLLCAFILQSWWMSVPACFAGILLTERFIQQLRLRRKERFEAGNVKAVRIMASALRTSPSYIHAFEQAAESPFVDHIVAHEYRRVVELLRGQVPVETVMKEFQQRTDSEDIAYLATIIQVQRELGGDMGKTLEKAALSILRRRQMQRRQRAAMSQLLAQVNLLSIMPFVFVISLYINNPHHFDPLTATFGGRVTILGALLAILVGGEVIRRVALRRFR